MLIAMMSLPSFLKGYGDTKTLLRGLCTKVILLKIFREYGEAFQVTSI